MPTRASGRSAKDNKPSAIGPPLVEEEGGSDPPRGEDLPDPLRPADAACFFVASEGEVDGALRPKAVRDQTLGRMQKGCERTLYILRSASPYRAFSDIARKRRVFPGGSILRRYDVEVRAENNGGV
jgi:hypothetical protein